MGDRCLGREAEALCHRFLHDQCCKCTVGNLTGVTRGHIPADLGEAAGEFLCSERWLESTELFKRRIAANAVIHPNNAYSLGSWHRDGNDGRRSELLVLRGCRVHM